MAPNAISALNDSAVARHKRLCLKEFILHLLLGLSLG